MKTSNQSHGQADNLEGAQGVWVRVRIQSTPEDIQGKNISESSLLPVIELVLRRSGIRIVEEEKFFSGAPVLLLEVFIFVVGRAWHCATSAKEALLSSNRPARSVRASGILSSGKRVTVVMATVWSNDTLGQGVSKEALSETVRSQAESFANDFLKANPK